MGKKADSEKTFTDFSAGSRVSVRDVAVAAGVSIASVSRVLNESGYASPALRERVARAVEQTGYAPNFAARHLRTGRSHAVGFMMSNLANPFLSKLVAEVERHMQAAGFSLLVASTYDTQAKEEELLALFESRQLEGIFAAPSLENLPPKINPFARCKLPLVIIDRDIDFQADAVYQNHRSAVAEAVAYLAALGHRRIALFGPSLAIRPGREKLLGYRDGLEACGLSFDPALVCMLRSAVDSPEQQMAEMLKLPQRPTALIGLGTRILSGALHTARQAGLDIPRDLSVIGIGHEDVFALMYPPMTTLRFNIAQAARMAADLMLERLKGEDRHAPPRSAMVTLDLVIGKTCAPPAAARVAPDREEE
jgi:LacI family transcriptional regulator